MIGDEIFDIAGEGFAFAHFDEFGVMVAALAGEDAPVIEACGVAFEVPFSDDAGVIACGLKIFGNSFFGNSGLDFSQTKLFCDLNVRMY